MIKLQQVRDDTLSLTDLIRLARTDLNLTITRQTVSRILGDFDMVSYIAPRKRLIKLQQVRDDTLSLTDLIRLARTDLNLTITRQTVSRILGDFDMVSYIAPRKLELLLHKDVLELPGVMNI